MSITFPTRPDGCSRPGTPDRAERCCCEPLPWPIIDSDTCLRCGRLPEHVISQTWADRARQLARKRTRKRAAA